MLCPFEWMTVYLIQSTPAEIKRGKKKLHSFFIRIRNVVFPALAEYFYFLLISGWKYSCIILKFIVYDISVLDIRIHWGINNSWYSFFSFCWLVLLFRERSKLKTYYCIALIDFHHTKLHHFHSLSLGFILKIFLKIRKFQPWYSSKIYSYIKRVYYGISIKVGRWVVG